MRSGAQGMIGYMGAVLAASVTFVFVSLGYGYLVDGALSAVQPFSERMAQLSLMAVFVLLLMTFFTFFLAFIPVWTVHTIAEKYSINRAWYFIVCGALTGVILSPIAVVLTPRMYSAPPVDPLFLEQVFRFCLSSVPSGAVGGWVYWWLTGQFIRRGGSVAFR